MKKIFTVFAMLCVAFVASQARDTLSIVIVGDIMMGMNYPDNSPRLPPKDGAEIFSHTHSFLTSGDFAIGNLEGVLLDKGGTPKSCRSNCYRFRMPERYARYLYDAGFRIMNVANNHSRDFGESGMKSTLRVLDEHNIKYAGFKNSCESTILEYDGLKIGFCGFAPNTGTVSVNDYTRAVEIVKDLRQSCDYVIVSMHAGAEGTKYTRVTRQRETYLGENRGNVYEFAHKMIDAGADMIVGHGPHVVRGIEMYKNKFIAYSLGNFCTPVGMNKSGKTGYAPAIKVVMDKSGNFIGGEILSAIQTGSENGPIPDAERKVVQEIRNLSTMDFPESKLQINDDGTIVIK